jgi:hypothetical protein
MARPTRKATHVLRRADGRQLEITLTGRTGWLADVLADLGARGVTVADLPAGTRLAAYAWKLKAAGVPLTVRNEKAKGPWGGWVSRYTLAADATLTRVSH